MKKIVVTAAYPFIPAELNIAHMASTFIPADVYSRYMKALGRECIFVSATDVHGVGVKQLVKNSDLDQKDLINKFHEKYQKQFKSLNIDFDVYERTDDDKVKAAVNNTLFRLYNNGYISKEKSSNYYCKNCGEYLPRRYRVKKCGETATAKGVYSRLDEDLVCGFCQSNNIEMQYIDHFYLNIKKMKGYLENVIDNQKNNTVRCYLKSILNKGLYEWDFTRDNYCGIPIPFENSDNQYIYLWYESLVAYMKLIPYADDFEFKHFIGKNIMYYHGIIWPIILKEGFGISNIEMQISARGFLNVNKTSKELIGIEDIANKYNPDYIRFYVLYKVRDNIEDFYFSIDSFANVINNILCRKIGGFLNRVCTILNRASTEFVPPIILDKSLTEIVVRIKNEIEEMALNKVIYSILEYIKKCGRIIEQKKFYIEPNDVACGNLCGMLAYALVLLAPYMPVIIENYNIFEGFNLYSINSIDLLEGKKINSVKSKWEKVDE